VHHKREAVNKMLRSSVRVEGKNMKILDKATAKKEQDFKKAGLIPFIL
jgi:Arc/MetJ family transcription regulator